MSNFSEWNCNFWRTEIAFCLFISFINYPLVAAFSVDPFQQSSVESPDGHLEIVRIIGTALETSWQNEEKNSLLMFTPNVSYILFNKQHNTVVTCGIDFQGGAGTPPRFLWSSDSHRCVILERPDRGIVKILAINATEANPSFQVFEPSQRIYSLLQSARGSIATHHVTDVFFNDDFNWIGNDLVTGTVQGGQDSTCEWTLKIAIAFSPKTLMKIIHTQQIK